MSVYYGVTRSDEYLAHYGVLGMKWGVRKDRSEGYKKVVKKLSNRATSTNSEPDYIHSSGELLENKKVMKHINKILKNNDFKRLSDAAVRFDSAKSALDENYFKYSKKLQKDRHGKTWDGDGTEEHWALEERYPAYKKLSDEKDKAQSAFAKEVDAAISTGKFDGIKKIASYKNYRVHIKPENSKEWVQEADARGWPIANAVYKKETGKDWLEMWPDSFIKWYAKGDKANKKYMYLDN